MNPTSKLKPPRVPQVRKPFLDSRSFDALLDLCHAGNFLGARRTAMLLMFSTTGARLTEMASLQLDDLDWKRSLILIRLGKGQKDRRVPFTNRAQTAVLRYLRYRTDDVPALWVTEVRAPMSANAVSTDMKRLVDRAGLDVKDRCHIFRRTWAAGAVRQGIPRQYAVVTGGWSTPRMLDHYTAAMMDEEEAIEAFKDFEPFGHQ